MTFTMKRVALELGVSITTVSKVLNNQPDIGPATRARVLKKVEELGYRPNAVARSLTLRRTQTLGVVIPDLMHSFFVEKRVHQIGDDDAERVGAAEGEAAGDGVGAITELFDFLEDAR